MVQVVDIWCHPRLPHRGLESLKECLLAMCWLLAQPVVPMVAGYLTLPNAPLCQATVPQPPLLCLHWPFSEGLAGYFSSHHRVRTCPVPPPGRLFSSVPIWLPLVHLYVSVGATSSGQTSHPPLTLGSYELSEHPVLCFHTRVAVCITSHSSLDCSLHKDRDLFAHNV